MKPLNERVISVGLGQAVFSTDVNTVLVIHGLGSCIGLALYDPVSRTGGLCHVVLPSSDNLPSNGAPAKFADQALTFALAQMHRWGVSRSSLRAKIVGGASLFSFTASPTLNVGARNTEEVCRLLREAGIHLAGKEVGGGKGRTMFFHLEDGRIEIATVDTDRIVL